MPASRRTTSTEAGSSIDGDECGSECWLMDCPPLIGRFAKFDLTVGALHQFREPPRRIPRNG